MGHVEQRLPVATGGPHVPDLVAADLLDRYGAAGGRLVAADLADRKALGIERHGQPLQAHNGRDALRDAYEESLDLVVYLRQVWEEGGDVGNTYVLALRVACRLASRTAAAGWRTTGQGGNGE